MLRLDRTVLAVALLLTTSGACSKSDRTADSAAATASATVVTMFEKECKDPYAPKVMREHQAMADDLEVADFQQKVAKLAA
jgi:hypothetical protein